MDLERIYRDNSGALFRYLCRFCGDPDTAADATQEAFLRLLDRPPPQTDRIRAWLFRVATNVVLDQGRKRRRRLRLLEGNPGRAEPGDPPDDPQVELERAERVREVRQALAALSPRDRMVLLMRAEGFTQREIGEAIEMNPKAMGSVLNRAQAKLAAALRIHPEERP